MDINYFYNILNHLLEYLSFKDIYYLSHLSNFNLINNKFFINKLLKYNYNKKLLYIIYNNTNKYLFSFIINKLNINDIDFDNYKYLFNSNFINYSFYISKNISFNHFTNSNIIYGYDKNNLFFLSLLCKNNLNKDLQIILIYSQYSIEDHSKFIFRYKFNIENLIDLELGLNFKLLKDFNITNNKNLNLKINNNNLLELILLIELLLYGKSINKFIINNLILNEFNYLYI